MPEVTADDRIGNGSIVQLKSGGPKMTVQNVGKFGFDEFESASCQWFVQDKAPWKQETGVFPLHSLKKVAED